MEFEKLKRRDNDFVAVKKENIEAVVNASGCENQR